MATKTKRKGLPSKKIEKFAKFALRAEGEAFRKKLSKKTGVRKVFRDELTNSDLGFNKITEAEIAFCEGWLRLARLQFGEKYFDEKLVVAIQEEIDMAKSSKMAG